jgi:capsular polysaccharide transport system permease protein
MEFLHSNIFRTIIVMARVIYALILRETKTRYGRLKIGYLWAFLEPMLFVSILSLISIYTGRLSSSEIPLLLFYVTGLLPFFLFRDITTFTMTAVKQNMALLYYPQVQIFDLCAARAILSLCTFIIVFSLFIIIIGLSGIEQIRIENPLILIQLAIYLTFMGFGCGTAIGALIPLFPSIEFLSRSLFVQPMFWISGIFFTVDVLPEDIRRIALLNPLLQIIEAFRSAFFYEYESKYLNHLYIFSAVLIVVFLGLLMQRVFRRHAFEA